MRSASSKQIISSLSLTYRSLFRFFKPPEFDIKKDYYSILGVKK